MQNNILDTIRWLRVIGDTIFATGAIGLTYFVFGLKFGWSVKDEIDISEENYPKVRFDQPK
jgi:nitric oxide reductase subunit B